MDQETLIMKERELLKTELQSLKHCQVQYFSFGITATGVLFGLGVKMGDGATASGATAGLLYLIPLLVIIPLWSIFFDKASSITRIVGYLRVLETLLAQNTGRRYQGWENALKTFREKEARDKHHFLVEPFVVIAHAICAVWPLVDFRRQHRYWAINWLSFCGLGICSLYMAHSSGADPSLVILFAVFFLGACVHNADVLWCLIQGNFRYDKREELWEEVLKAEIKHGD
jgi:hypothetical protein